MKTAKQWFDLLPKEVRDKALEAIKEQHNNSPIAKEIDLASHILNKYYSSIGEALASSFIWGDTQDKQSYWEGINDDLS